jgi:osmoprotectant transport system permease protein
VKNRSLVKLTALILILLSAGLAPLPRRAVQVRIGSKKFTESVILGEMLRLLAEESNLGVAHYREF